MAYKIRQNASPFFTAGRPSGVNKIILHHAATTDFDGIGRTFKTKGTSAHYGVGRNDNVDQYVSESNIAYHAGDWPANQTSIGIENVNMAGAPNWEVDDKTIATLIELVRDVAQRHGLLPLVVGKNLFQHKDFSATYCAGRVGDKLQYIAEQVNKAQSPIVVAPTKRSNDEIATEVLNGKWGNNPARANALKAAGYDPNAIQAIVNARLGVGGAPAPAPAKASVSEIARQVIAGSFGNGDARIANIKRAGYDYNTVQAEVNRQLGVSVRPVVNLDAVATDVIAGKYGNNPERANRLRAAGFDPNAVQALVNRKLGY